MTTCPSGDAVQDISQVFLKASGVAALFFLAGLAVNSLAAAIVAGGAILAVVTAHLLGAESDLITGGLLGFSPVLTAMALGTVFTSRAACRSVLPRSATIFTVITQAAFNVALTPLAIPALDGAVRVCDLDVPAAATTPRAGACGADPHARHACRHRFSRPDSRLASRPRSPRSP